jgi:N-methylhydantoinase A/oxoprolinase/acetone carboxylase beta subunit
VAPLDLARAERDLRAAWDDGIRAVAIVLMHGYRYPQHEKALADLARGIGFPQVSVSFEVSPLMKLVSRGDTTVVDAYLSPILRRYVAQVERELTGGRADSGIRLQFMQSSGGLTDAHLFQGKDAILSGPAGGIVGAVEVSRLAGFDRIIGFDMGGTSTDVTHWAGEYERAFVTEVAGVRLRAPMMSIHTVAAGGGSVCSFDGARFRVGPESAGANPGPASYRRGGPLTVTDCNVMVGKLDPDLFPKVFGPGGDEALDAEVVHDKFAALAAVVPGQGGVARTAEEVAAGFLRIAVENMANAIKHISVQRGYDVTEYTLCCFGGAGGQHACLVADALGMTRVFIHPLAGVLSAYGMGLADVRALRQQAVEAELSEAALATADARTPHWKRRRARKSKARASRRADRVPAHAAHEVRRHRHDARDPLAMSAAAPTSRRVRESRSRISSALPAAVRLPDAGQGAGHRGDRGRGHRPRRIRVGSHAAVRAARRPARAAQDQSRVHRRRVSRRVRVRPRRPASGRRHCRTRDHPRAQCDDGDRAGLARDAYAARSPHHGTRRGGAAHARDRHHLPIRCSSRCSTTSSWRSPSRWASRSPTPPIR